MAKILLIDDDQTLHDLLGQYLEDKGYTLIHALRGEDAPRLLFRERPDLVILDIMLPGMDGWETLRRIREMSDVPVILLTVMSDEQDKLRGFELAADDYMEKPFSYPLLAARIGAILRRSGSRRSEDDDILRGGDVKLNQAAHRVTKAGQEVKLTTTEFRLLAALMRNKGRVLTPEQLLAEAWGPAHEDKPGHVRRYIWRLRQKIEHNPHMPQYLLTVHGVGYIFDD